MTDRPTDRPRSRTLSFRAIMTLAREEPGPPTFPARRARKCEGSATRNKIRVAEGGDRRKLGDEKRREMTTGSSERGNLGDRSMKIELQLRINRILISYKIFMCIGIRRV